jgi:hypothetical protein
MLREKLLTIACAVGILACGACFLPPIDSPPHPTAPPLREALRGIKTIRVVVDDASEAHTLDPSELASCIAGALRSRVWRTHVELEDQETPQAGDAVLHIKLIKVTSTTDPGTNEMARLWFLEVALSATLIDAHGQTIWQQNHPPYDLRIDSQSDNPTAVWKEPQVRAWLSYGVSDNVLDKMFYGN